jgi:hypothetical protein
MNSEEMFVGDKFICHKCGEKKLMYDGTPLCSNCDIEKIMDIKWIKSMEKKE